LALQVVRDVDGFRVQFHQQPFRVTAAFGGRGAEKAFASRKKRQVGKQEKNEKNANGLSQKEKG